MPNILGTIVIGLVAGWLAGFVMKGRGFGIIGNIVVGIVGALVGAWLFTWLGIGVESILGEIVMGTIGAIVLLFIIGLVRRGAAEA